MEGGIKEESELDNIEALLRSGVDVDLKPGLANNDIVLMKRAWLNEQFSPEILEYQTNLVKDLLDLIENQVHQFHVSRLLESFALDPTLLPFAIFVGASCHLC